MRFNEVWERDLASEEFLAADVKTASEKLKNGVIAGYEVRDIGGISGLLTISPVGDRFIATWNAIVSANEEQKLIDVSLARHFAISAVWNPPSIRSSTPFSSIRKTCSLASHSRLCSWIDAAAVSHSLYRASS